MCDTGSLSKGLSLAGLGFNTYGAYNQSKATQDAYNAQALVQEQNAILAEWQAKDAIERGHLAEQRLDRDARQVKGTQIATMAASGVDLDYGTPLDVFAGTDAIAAEDAHTLRVNAENEAYGYRMDAYNYRTNAASYRSRAAAEDPDMSAFTTLLTGGAQVADRWYR